MSTTTMPEGGARPAPRPVAPESRLGWWSIGLMMVAFFAMAINGPLFMSGLVHLNAVGGVIYTGILGGAAVAAAVCSILAMGLRHDRSCLLYFPLIPAALVLLLVAGEFIGPPH